MVVIWATPFHLDGIESKKDAEGTPPLGEAFMLLSIHFFIIAYLESDGFFSSGGLRARKLRYKRRSYKILRLPEIMKGAFNKRVFASKGPVKMGDSEAPVVRAMPVIPAAAERSSGLTTAMV